MQQIAEMKLGHYRIQRLLARGGMADIYLAEDAETQQTVAIKMVHESAADTYERFRLEVKEMAALKHKHILPVLDYGEHEEWYYMVMPYIEYGTLNDILKTGPLTLEEAGRMLEQLTDALHFAHNQGIVHRDIKPSNVLLRDSGFAYLADFGLVKRIGEDNGITLTGYLIGTPEYLAPELIDDEATPQSDIYALGILLYQMLAGCVPFRGNTPVAIYMKHIQQLPTPPSHFNPAIPAAIEHVILRALDKNPLNRFQTAQQFSYAYQQALVFAARADVWLEDSAHIPTFVCAAPEIKVGRKQLTGQQAGPLRQLTEAIKGLSREKRNRLLILMVASLLMIVPILISTSFSYSDTQAVKPATQHTIKRDDVLTPATRPTHPPPTPTPTPVVTPSSQTVDTNTPNQTVNGSNFNSNTGNSGIFVNNGSGNNANTKPGKEKGPGNGKGKGHKK